MTAALTSVARFARLDRWDPQELAETPQSYRWPTAMLGEVAQVRLGVQVPRKGSENRGVARPYLRALNVRRAVFDLTDVKTMYVAETQANQLNLQAGDLLFVEGSGSISAVGRCALWDATIPDAIHQNSVIRARLHDVRVDPHFAVTWFNSRAGNAYIREQATTTSGLYHIGVGKLARAPMPVPPLDVQRDLAAQYWHTLQQAEEAATRSADLTIAAWTRFATQVVDEPDTVAAAGIVTVTSFAALDRWDTDARPIDIASPHPVVRLDDVADVRLGVQLQRSKRGGQEVPYVRVANVQRGRLDLADVKTMNVDLETIARLALQRHDLLLLEANSLEEVGRCARWDGEIPVCIHQNHVIRARLTTDALLPQFAEAWFNSPPGRSYVRARARTTSGTLFTIPVSVLAASPVPVPSIEDQERFVAGLQSGLTEARQLILHSQQLQERAELDLMAILA